MFGALQILTGLRYRMPMPVQPLKAMAALVIAHQVSGTVLAGGGLAIGVLIGGTTLGRGVSTRVDNVKMSDCCCATKSTPSVAIRCPESGAQGSTVSEATVKALLTEAALTRFVPAEYRFCPDPNCLVVYFAAHGVVFRVADVRVPVWQKLPFGTRPVCYCLGETEGTIRAEIETTGRSLAADRIRAHIAAGRCACELRNPRGACCLGDVVAAIKRVCGGHEDRAGAAAAQAHDW
jgi:hypothetical protein